MRTFEILILLLDAVLIIVLLFPNSRPRYLLLIASLSASLAVVLQLLVEGYRWQMTLAYLLTAILLVIAFFQSRSAKRQDSHGWRITIFALLGLVAIVLVAALPVLLPVPNLPEPTGKYQIGTTTYHIVDETREEIYGDDPGGYRELMLQLWYPADPGAANESAPYFDQLKLAASVIAERIGLPSFFLGHLDLVDTHSQIGAPPPAGEHSYPLIIFSHGLSGLRMQNTAQFEELASHGYIVASVDHTYDSVITILPDGRVKLHHGQTVMPEGVSTIESGSLLLSVRVEDINTILRFIEDQNQDPDGILQERIDLDRIGVMGHSTGGGTAIDYCAQSAHCQAVVVLDGWLEPVTENALGQPLDQPSLYLSTEEWLGKENKAIGESFIDLQEKASYQVTIEGMGHNNFSDIPLLTPIAAEIGLGGSIDGARGIQILNEYTLAFFDRYLMGAGDSQLELISDRYPEVNFQSN